MELYDRSNNNGPKTDPCGQVRGDKLDQSKSNGPKTDPCGQVKRGNFQAIKK